MSSVAESGVSKIIVNGRKEARYLLAEWVSQRLNMIKNVNSAAGEAVSLYCNRVALMFKATRLRGLIFSAIYH